MPFVQVKVIEGVFSSEQKRQLLQKVSDAVISVEGENLRQVTTVVIEEVKSLDWATGGKPLSTEYVKDLAAGKKKAA